MRESYSFQLVIMTNTWKEDEEEVGGGEEESAK